MLSPMNMWYKTGRIVMKLSRRLEISPERALDLYYTQTKVCDQMHSDFDKLYLFGDNYIVEEFILQMQGR